MKRVNNLFPVLISDDNIRLAIEDVNNSHRWNKHHVRNEIVAQIESDVDYYVKDLRRIVIEGFVPSKMKEMEIYDVSAGKKRIISEPKLYPDQCIHHMLVQVLQPVILRGMDKHSCGSIRGRGMHYGKRYIEKWVRNDIKNTKYCLEADIYHFYDSINPKYLLDRMRCLIKDYKVMDLIERVTKDGIKIGVYSSQWFANVLLQPLDRLIRNSGCAKHYIRYIDNITIFGTNKRKLHRLIVSISECLETIGLKLKGNYQVFKVKDRLPSALGYRYGRTYTLLRKKSLLRLKRKLRKAYKKDKLNIRLSFKEASGLISRLGMLNHCNSKNIIDKYVKKKLLRALKNIVRLEQEVRLRIEITNFLNSQYLTN